MRASNNLRLNVDVAVLLAVAVCECTGQAECGSVFLIKINSVDRRALVRCVGGKSRRVAANDASGRTNHS